MKKVHFIVNPIAGKGKNALDQEFLEQHFPDTDYQIRIKYSEYKGHAITLTHESRAEGAELIVACGGDGTVNEVASALVGSQIALGIIPMGSGNGLASNLHIPREIDKALEIIKKQTLTRIDVGLCNGSYFFSNTGFGFDARLIQHYERYAHRTLKHYIKAGFKTFFDKNNNDVLNVTVNGKKQFQDPLLIFISNSNELGYNFSLTPSASLDDGLLDVIIVPKMSKVRLLWFALLFIFKKHHLLKEIVSFRTQKLSLMRTTGTYFKAQMDGEYKELTSEKINIELLKASLLITA